MGLQQTPGTIFGRSVGYAYVTHAFVLSEKRGASAVAEIAKFSNNLRNRVTFAVNRAIARNSASALEWETAVCFFVFQAMREPPRIKQ
jgi:hypothetical protein